MLLRESARPRLVPSSEDSSQTGHFMQPFTDGVAMTRQQVLDLYFMDARAKLLDLAAFMDRVDRAEGPEDFRMKAFRETIAVLNAKKNRAEKVLLSFSDPTKQPIPAATTKAASGAYPPLPSAARKTRKNS